jgi:hypothetical protein
MSGSSEPGTGALYQVWLSSNGGMDQYLSGQPQITFFKRVYLRHTLFATEYKEITSSYNNLPTYGSSFYIDLSNDPAFGDLLRKLFVEIHLDQPFLIPCHRAGHQLLEEVRFEISNLPVETHYSLWMDIYVQLTCSLDEFEKINRMINGSLRSEFNNTPTTKLYIPLYFWFTTHPGLALPLLSLQNYSKRIYFKLRDHLVFSLPPTLSPQSPLPIENPLSSTQFRAVHPNTFSPLPIFQTRNFTGDFPIAGSYSWTSTPPITTDPQTELRVYVSPVNFGTISVNAQGRIESMDGTTGVQRTQPSVDLILYYWLQLVISNEAIWDDYVELFTTYVDDSESDLINIIALRNSIYISMSLMLPTLIALLLTSILHGYITMSPAGVLFLVANRTKAQCRSFISSFPRGLGFLYNEHIVRILDIIRENDTATEVLNDISVYAGQLQNVGERNIVMYFRAILSPYNYAEITNAMERMPIFENLLSASNTNSITFQHAPRIVSFQLWGDIIFLDHDEQKKWFHSRTEYLIYSCSRPMTTTTSTLVVVP